MSTALPGKVRLVEVGPRDGLQNESQPIAVETRVELVNRLADAGLPVVETGSFVNPKWIPQMASSEDVFAGIERRAGTSYAALTPNLKGFERAMAAGADEVAVFGAASEAFSQKNINCSIAESLQRFEAVMAAAKEHNLPVRGYLSCVLGCPYEGEIDPEVVADLSLELLAMGCYEVSLGDTIGTGTPGSMQRLLDTVLPQVQPNKLAVHCHDTYGQALANILVALNTGIATVDASVAGLGGCPYAKGATGNVATEDVVFLLESLGLKTGVDLQALMKINRWMEQKVQHVLPSRVGKAGVIENIHV